MNSDSGGREKKEGGGWSRNEVSDKLSKGGQRGNKRGKEQREKTIGGGRELWGHLSIATSPTLGIDRGDSQSVNMLNNKLFLAGTEKRWGEERRKLVKAVNTPEKQTACP